MEEFRDRQKPRNQKVASAMIGVVLQYLADCELALVRCGEVGVWGDQVEKNNAL